MYLTFDQGHKDNLFWNGESGLLTNVKCQSSIEKISQAVGSSAENYDPNSKIKEKCLFKLRNYMTSHTDSEF